MPGFQDQKSTLKNHSAWLKQLHLEYGRICQAFRLSLRPPVLHLASGQRTLGQWNPETRTLSVSVRLIETRPWSFVLEVLRHEMAHQIVSEIFKSGEGHGKLFRKACQMTGASAQASQATMDPDNFQEPSRSCSPGEDRMLRRAKKLLALANSSNVNEACIAMEKVKVLSRKFNLNVMKYFSEEPFVTACLSHKKKRTECWQSLIASLLSSSFSVRVIHTTMFDQYSLQEYRAFELIGLKRHVVLAEYVYWFIYNNLPGLWDVYQKESGKKGLKTRNQFYQGVITGLSEKLKDSDRPLTDQTGHTKYNSGGMLVIEAQRLNRFVRQRHPDLRTDTLKSRRWDLPAYEAGKKKGHELNLHKGISKNPGSETLFLDAKPTT